MGGGGDRGAKAPLKVSKMGKIRKCGIFSCTEINFSVMFNEEIHALEGFL